MTRTSWPRTVVIALALPAVLARPVSAVAHGLDHGHTQEHAAAGELVAPKSTDKHAQVAVLEVEDEGHHGEHAHHSLDATVCSRHDVTEAAPAHPVAIQFVVVSGSQGVAVQQPRPRVHGANAPPPNLRGPPAPR